MQHLLRYYLVFALGILTTACAPLHTGQRANIIIDDAHSGGNVLAFSADETLLASGGLEGKINLWRTKDGQSTGSWQAHSESVEGLGFVHNNSRIISAGYDGAITVWDLHGKVLRRITTPSPITHMVLHDASRQVVTGHVDGAVRVWHLPDLKMNTEYKQLHHGAIRAVALHAASGKIASSGQDGQVFLLKANTRPQALPAPPTDAWSLAFSADGLMLSGGGWFKVFQWDLAKISLRVLDTEHKGIISGIQYSHNGKFLATISRQLDSAVYFLEPDNASVLRRFQSHDLCGGDLHLSRTDRYLATTSDDASVRIWDLKTK